MEQAGTEINSTYSAILNEVEAPLQDGMSAQTLERFQAKRITLAAGERENPYLGAEIEPVDANLAWLKRAAFGRPGVPDV